MTAFLKKSVDKLNASLYISSINNALRGSPMNAVMIKIANRNGAALLPDNAQYTNRLEIRSATSSRLYIVAQHKTNHNWSCGCMGWIRHRKCKHLEAIMPQIQAATKALGGVR